MTGYTVPKYNLTVVVFSATFLMDSRDVSPVRAAPRMAWHNMRAMHGIQCRGLSLSNRVLPFSAINSAWHASNGARSELYSQRLITGGTGNCSVAKYVAKVTPMK